MKNHTIVIEKIIAGGMGLGRIPNGMIVLCPFVLPGEKVIAREVKQYRGYIVTELIDIVEPSPHRTHPACPYYKRCGGCNFQHIEYKAQLVVKKDIVQETLHRSKIDTDLVELQPVIPSPQSYKYRYRIRLKLSRDGKLGFYKTGSNTLVKIDRCLVASDRINNALHELNTSGILPEAAQFFRELQLMQSPADNLIHAVFYFDKNIEAPVSLLADYADSSQNIDHFSVSNGKSCETVSSSTPALVKQNFPENICGRSYTLTWSPDCFSQVNAEQNCNLIKHALSLIGSTEDQRVLDLYCGMGNFSIPIGISGTKKLTGIEINRNSISRAEVNARFNSILNSRFIQGDVLKQLKRIIRDHDVYDILVLDPPRQGVGKSTHLLAELNPSRILYISCDPATLTRDLASLAGRGYRTRIILPVDMFPQTHHIESMALLEKN